jgi:hypothetical protein
MDELKALELLANKCLHCGCKPKAYHQDYEGDKYIGDEYSFECECGITTNFMKKEQLLNIWNSIFTHK